LNETASEKDKIVDALEKAIKYLEAVQGNTYSVAADKHTKELKANLVKEY
jgi:hypothetical protein